jgi:non-heme chloroperoxidase
MLFLTGMGVTPHTFDNLAPQFTPRFRVLGFTRRGLGKSDKPATGYDTATLTDDVRGFLDALPLERVTLVDGRWQAPRGHALPRSIRRASIG